MCSVCRTACFRGLIRESDAGIGFGSRGTLESMCALLHGRPILIDEPRYSAVSGCVRAAIVCRRRRRLGLTRGFGCEIGFGPISEPWPVWLLAGHGLGTAVFRCFRIDTDCVRCRTACFRGLIRKSDTEIGFGPRRTLGSVCARLHDRPIIINEPRYSGGVGLARVVGVCRSGSYPWTSSEIGPRDWIWFGFGAVAGLSAGWSWSGDRGIPTF